MDAFLYIVMPFKHWAVGCAHLHHFLVFSMRFGESLTVLHEYQESICGVGQPILVYDIEHLHLHQYFSLKVSISFS